MRKAFTITELLVAVAVLAVTMTAVGGIFKMAIDSQRTAEATSEIMRNLRAITDQINADFKGFRPGPAAAIVFQVTDPNIVPDPNIRSDRIVFFANGDFQSTRQYEYKKSTTENAFKTVVGNAARIWYGQSTEPNPSDPNEDVRRKKLLLRRVQILTDDSRLIDQTESNPYDGNDTREYDVRSMAEWRVFQQNEMPNDPNAFDQWLDLLVSRPSVELADPNYIPMVMARGVDDFTVQFSGPLGNRLNWWPSNQQVRAGNLVYPGSYDAIRFVFTLYDSKGILKGGRRFSHTVYLKDKL
jgi:prepilin-type N-terminal cleavage/methylation domain-containing protein